MSLYNIIQSLNLNNTNNNRIALYSSIKIISNYIKGETSKLKKSELINFTCEAYD